MGVRGLVTCWKCSLTVSLGAWANKGCACPRCGHKESKLKHT